MASTWKGTKHQDRTALCATLLSEGWKKHEIYHVLKQRYEISSQQCQRYVSRARKHLIMLADKDRKSAKGESLEFYQKIVKNDLETTDMRLKAQARIDKILGLEEPVQVNQFVSGKQETTIKIEYSGDDWQRMPAFDLSTDGN